MIKEQVIENMRYVFSFSDFVRNIQPCLGHLPPSLEQELVKQTVSVTVPEVRNLPDMQSSDSWRSFSTLITFPCEQ